MLGLEVGFSFDLRNRPSSWIRPPPEFWVGLTELPEPNPVELHLALLKELGHVPWPSLSLNFHQFWKH